MTWEIMLGIIALVGFVGSVASWISKLSRALATLDATIKALNEVIRELKANSHETHSRLFAKQEEHERRLGEHDVRIKSLEEKL